MDIQGPSFLLLLAHRTFLELQSTPKQLSREGAIGSSGPRKVPTKFADGSFLSR